MELEEALKQMDGHLVASNYAPSQLPDWLRVLYLISSLDFEVMNGGVDQWLSNSSGDYATETALALLTIGATRTADLVQRIIAIFPEANPPKDRIIRMAMMRSFEPKIAAEWERLGSEILKWPDDIDTLLRSFVCAR